jgi:hypothetical protein
MLTKGESIFSEFSKGVAIVLKLWVVLAHFVRQFCFKNDLLKVRENGGRIRV